MAATCKTNACTTSAQYPACLRSRTHEKKDTVDCAPGRRSGRARRVNEAATVRRHRVPPQIKKRCSQLHTITLNIGDGPSSCGL